MTDDDGAAALAAAEAEEWISPADLSTASEATRRLSTPAAGRRGPRAPEWVRNFDNLSHEWRRWFSETLGTFLLVLAGAGGAVVSARLHTGPGPGGLVVAPGLMVMVVILFMGGVSGAHLNPVVSIAFALRREFPWKRVPVYVLAQATGAVLACLCLRAIFGKAGHLGATLPAPGLGDVRAMLVEALLTLGLVSTILGTASGAQNVGPLSALAVGAYICLAGLWAGSVSGASMNPARSFGPDVVNGQFGQFWVYLVGPVIGMLAAVGGAIVLRGRGGDPTAIRAAQGSLP